jgi:tyrosyl-tRNA synthetase
MKKIAVGNLGEEELARFKQIVLTRNLTRAQAETLFSHANQAKAQAQRKVEGLFVQAKGAETMAPTLAKTASVTENVDAFFDKLAEDSKTDAQKRYPELLKISVAPGVGTRPTPAVKRPASALPVQSSLAGGAA